MCEITSDSWFTFFQLLALGSFSTGLALLVLTAAYWVVQLFRGKFDE